MPSIIIGDDLLSPHSQVNLSRVAPTVDHPTRNPTKDLLRVISLPVAHPFYGHTPLVRYLWESKGQNSTALIH